jgi:succinate dehydrogenase / fumarate reductase cytochrome b subunit
MAITGMFLFLFVVAHLIGNLALFRGQEALNSYAAMLQGLGPLLWVARLGLLAVLVVHLRCALALTAKNRNARPVGYVSQQPIKSTFASRTMLMSGLVILLFVVYHLLHFTLGVVQADNAKLVDAAGRHDVYSMVVLGFQSVPVALTYVAAMVLLGMHLTHGLQSLFQSLGLTKPKYRGFITLAATSLTLLVVVGNIALPMAVQMGIIKLPGGAS